MCLGGLYAFFRRQKLKELQGATWANKMGVCLRGDWDELETHIQSQVASPIQLTGGNSVVRSSDFSQSVGRLHREIWNVGL